MHKQLRQFSLGIDADPQHHLQISPCNPARHRRIPQGRGRVPGQFENPFEPDKIFAIGKTKDIEIGMRPPLKIGVKIFRQGVPQNLTAFPLPFFLCEKYFFAEGI